VGDLNRNRVVLLQAELSKRAVVHTGVVVALGSTGLSTRAEALDVPGSIPGTTTVFATDEGISVGTYDFQLGFPFDPQRGTYGFIFDGTDYRTFIPSFIGSPPSDNTNPSGENLSGIGVFNALDQVNIRSFNKTGGIGYTITNQRSGEPTFDFGFVRSGIQDDFSTETNLFLLLDEHRFVTTPGGQPALVLSDFVAVPTFIK